MYVLLGTCLLLSGLLVINSLGSILAALVWRFSSRAAERWSTSARAQVLFLLRALPPACALFCVGTVFLPSYLANEPRETTEVVTFKLGLLAAASLYTIGTALSRGWAAWRATHRLTTDWMRHAKRVPIEGGGIPMFQVPHPFPLIAILGTMRPKVFIAEKVLASLNERELMAALAHEKGHLVAGDNLKRGVLKACRDSLLFDPFGRTLDEAWVANAELAADEYAARIGAPVALDLAAALVKVARMVPRGVSPAIFAGTFLIAQQTGGIRQRVLRLTQLAARPDILKPSRTMSNGQLAACLAGGFLALSVIVSTTGLSVMIHSALECIVSVLQ